MPVVNSKPINQAFNIHNFNQETIGLSKIRLILANYVVIDNRRHRKSDTE